jgi:hypothetical protein
MSLRNKTWALVFALVLCAASAFAQDQRQDTPQPDPNAPLQPLGVTPPPNPAPYQPATGGYANPPIGAARGVDAPDDSLRGDPAQTTPDANTLAGAAPFTLGTLQHNRNIFDPVISVSQLGQTVPAPDGGAVLTGISVVGGSLNFDHTAGAFHFSAIYNGGETFNLGYGAAPNYFASVAPHYQFHDLAVAEQVVKGRWHLLFRDDFTASPGAAFTGQGMGGPGLISEFSGMLGASLSSFAQAFLPNESINTGEAMRIRNSFLGQAEYSLSRRSEFTFSGSYGLLHFTQAGYVNSSLVGAQAGYDYQLSPSNSIAILGSYGRISFNGISTPTVDYVGAFAYGRRITGRLAFQVAAGPQEIHATAIGSLGNFSLLFASVNSALTYQRRRAGFSFNYVRGLSGGSGVFQGATSNTFTARASYQFTRNWTGNLNGGYAINNSLAPAGVSTTQFDTWFFGGNLARRLGLWGQINFNYGALNQAIPVTCPVVSCGGTGLQETFGMSFNWHLVPITERR